LAEIILQPSFDERELNTFAENNIQSLMVDLTKNDIVAYRQITELMYGKDHPYGYNSTPDDYRALKRTDLQRYHRENYTPDNMLIFVSGRFDDDVLKLLNQHLGQFRSDFIKTNTPLSFTDEKPQSIRIKNPDSLQSSIRLGRRFGSRRNSDFEGFFVLNTVLGGYFGSRLMTNIREKKGYTYNIYSSLDLMLHDGYFYIGADVGNEYLEATIKEIYKEIAVLQRTLIGNDELKMVRNYILGNMLNMVDGPFAVSDVIRTLKTEGVGLEAFEHFVRTVRNITPEELRLLAQKYLRKEDLFEVIVGS
jgi:predicted Zn-dependent peptidase